GVPKDKSSKKFIIPNTVEASAISIIDAYGRTKPSAPDSTARAPGAGRGSRCDALRRRGPWAEDTGPAPQNTGQRSPSPGEEVAQPAGTAALAHHGAAIRVARGSSQLPAAGLPMQHNVRPLAAAPSPQYGGR
ncbi:hypothetical protein U0070_004330, partial [Myodes glareolus]